MHVHPPSTPPSNMHVLPPSAPPQAHPTEGSEMKGVVTDAHARLPPSDGHAGASPHAVDTDGYSADIDEDKATDVDNRILQGVVFIVEDEYVELTHFSTVPAHLECPVKESDICGKRKAEATQESPAKRFRPITPTPEQEQAAAEYLKKVFDLSDSETESEEESEIIVLSTDSEDIECYTSDDEIYPDE